MQWRTLKYTPEKKKEKRHTCSSSHSNFKEIRCDRNNTTSALEGRLMNYPDDSLWVSQKKQCSNKSASYGDIRSHCTRSVTAVAAFCPATDPQADAREGQTAGICKACNHKRAESFFLSRAFT